jgi:primosomal protein N' (replication factor Y)
VKQSTAQIMLPIPAGRTYTYAVPDGMELAPGDIVQAPLGPRIVAGVVWDGESLPVDPAKLRPLTAKFDCPPLRKPMRAFVDWVANWTLASPGMVLRMVLRAPGAFDPPAPVTGIRFAGKEPERMTGPRQAVLALARGGMAWSRSGLAHAAGVSAGVVDGLIRAGCFETVELPPQPAVPLPDPDHGTIELSLEQKAVAEALRQTIAEQRHSVSVIDGVTGSGKTEVYFEAVAETLRNDGQALILLPEIALTASFLERFEARFGARPAEWHSDVGPVRREQVWRQVATGQVRVVAGARSALFLPFENLRLIVVDEEHDAAYKQEDRVFYNARDMAVVRAHLEGAPAILASATPSVETRVNCEAGKYRWLRLPERHANAALPQIRVVDLRTSPPQRGKFLSPPLVTAVTAALERKEQALLFLNRRGYAPVTLCRVCGFRFECANCSAWLVEHRFRRVLQCHHCGHHEPVPEACPNCGALDHLAACGPGVERIAEETVERFPDARVVVLSSDLLTSASRLRAELEAIAKGEADIVIGTQLVAKGHHFPLLTCVGVVDADLGLANGDPRASERTFQLLHQVVGRAGRADRPGIGYLQTWQPDHPVLRAIANDDREGFYQEEIAARRAARLPPFGRLAALIVSAGNRGEAEGHARNLRRAAPAIENGRLRILGPAEAPMAMVRGRYRFRLLVHCERRFDLQGYLRGWLAVAPREKGSVRLQIDVDPQSFL